LNQNETSATSGANVAELPVPTSRPWMIAYVQMLPAAPAATIPIPSAIVPAITGTMTPNRSERRPIRMPPRPKPTIVSVYGNEAAPRATSNSACTAGSTTTTDHIPAPPSVESTTAARRRTHAYGDSAWLTVSFIAFTLSQLCRARFLERIGRSSSTPARCIDAPREI
jgi:hypothetical protein